MIKLWRKLLAKLCGEPDKTILRRPRETARATGDGHGDLRYKIDHGDQPAARLHTEPLDDSDRP